MARLRRAAVKAPGLTWIIRVLVVQRTQIRVHQLLRDLLQPAARRQPHAEVGQPPARVGRRSERLPFARLPLLAVGTAVNTTAVRAVLRVQLAVLHAQAGGAHHGVHHVDVRHLRPRGHPLVVAAGAVATIGIAVVAAGFHGHFFLIYFFSRMKRFFCFIYLLCCLPLVSVYRFLTYFFPFPLPCYSR